MEKKTTLGITPLELSIGIAVLLAMLLCHLAEAAGIRLQTLAVCTSAVMCVQEGKAASWKAGITRMLGVLCGGAAGVLIVLLDQWAAKEAVFMLLCGAGVIGNLLLCKAVKLPLVHSRVSCMSLLLVVLVLQDTDRLRYAAGRFTGTLCGAAIALAVSMLSSCWTQKRN